MSTAPSNCEMLVKDLVGSKTNLAAARKQLNDAYTFSCLDSCISPRALTSAEVSHSTETVMMAFANLRHL